MAAYVTAAAGAALTLAWLACAAPRPPIWLHPARALLHLGAAAAAVVLPAALALALVAGPDAWRALLVFPATDFAGVRAEAYPPWAPPAEALRAWGAAPSDPVLLREAAGRTRAWLVGHLPELIFAAAAPALYLRRRSLAPTAVGGALLCLAVLPLLWVAAHVQQNTHFNSMGTFGLLLLALLGSGLRAKPGRALLGAAAAVYAVGLCIAPALAAGRALLEWEGSQRLELPGLRGVRVPAADREVVEPLARFVAEHVPAGEPIHVGLVRHDATVISRQVLYFAVGRPPATRYPELHPGVSDRAAVQREMIAAIEATGARCVILWEFGWPHEVLEQVRDRNRAAVPDAGSTLLDAWLRERFAPLAQFGEYHLGWRADLPRPPGW